MQLNGPQAHRQHNLTDMLRLEIHEYSYLLHAFRQILCNLPRRFDANVSRTLLIKDKPYGIRPGINRDERVLQISHPTNLHPSHRRSCPLEVKSSAHSLTAR